MPFRVFYEVASNVRKKVHLMPNCRKLISADEPSCPYCGILRPGLHNTRWCYQKYFSRFRSGKKTIIYINIAYFILSLL